MRALIVLGVGLAAACGSRATDPASSYTLRGRWEEPSDITFRLDAEGAPVPPSVLERAFLAARRAWEGAGRVRLRRARSGEVPDFTVSFAAGSHGDCPPFGRGPEVAHAGPVRPGTFLHLDRERAWEREGGPDLELTVLHELGHVLGLDHSPDPRAVMHSAPVSTRLQASDRDALRTLYGGPPPGPRDLVLERGGTRFGVVYGLRPGADFELFDTDGDGDDELCLWRTDPQGNGSFTALHFAPGALPLRTMGPRPGMVDPAASIRLLARGGQRFLILEWANGHRIARTFDGLGRLQSGDPAALPETLPPATRRRDGDLDGDGTLERVR